MRRLVAQGWHLLQLAAGPGNALAAEEKAVKAPEGQADHRNTQTAQAPDPQEDHQEHHGHLTRQDPAEAEGKAEARERTEGIAAAVGLAERRLQMVHGRSHATTTASGNVVRVNDASSIMAKCQHRRTGSSENRDGDLDLTLRRQKLWQRELSLAPLDIRPIPLAVTRKRRVMKSEANRAKA